MGILWAHTYEHCRVYRVKITASNFSVHTCVYTYTNVPDDSSSLQCFNDSWGGAMIGVPVT